MTNGDVPEFALHLQAVSITSSEATHPTEILETRREDDSSEPESSSDGCLQGSARIYVTQGETSTTNSCLEIPPIMSQSEEATLDVKNEVVSGAVSSSKRKCCSSTDQVLKTRKTDPDGTKHTTKRCKNDQCHPSPQAASTIVDPHYSGEDSDTSLAKNESDDPETNKDAWLPVLIPEVPELPNSKNIPEGAHMPSTLTTRTITKSSFAFKLASLKNVIARYGNSKDDEEKRDLKKVWSEIEGELLHRKIICDHAPINSSSQCGYSGIAQPFPLVIIIEDDSDE